MKLGSRSCQIVVKMIMNIGRSEFVCAPLCAVRQRSSLRRSDEVCSLKEFVNMWMIVVKMITCCRMTLRLRSKNK